MDLVTKSTNWDTISDYLAIERLDAKGGEKAVEKIKEIEKQRDDNNRKIQELENKINELEKKPSEESSTPADLPLVSQPSQPEQSSDSGWLPALIDALKSLFSGRK